jgi:hypothetical protein
LSAPSDRAAKTWDIAIDQLATRAGRLETDGEFVFRKGERRIVAMRGERKQHAENLWRRALLYGRIIAAIPYVRMIAVTGALSMDNVDPGDDIALVPSANVAMTVAQ